MTNWIEFVAWYLGICLMVLVPLLLAVNGAAIAAHVEALLQRRRLRRAYPKRLRR